MCVLKACQPVIDISIVWPSLSILHIALLLSDVKRFMAYKTYPIRNGSCLKQPRLALLTVRAKETHRRLKAACFNINTLSASFLLRVIEACRMPVLINNLFFAVEITGISFQGHAYTDFFLTCLIVN